MRKPRGDARRRRVHPQDVHAVIFLYDSTSRDSFTALSGWIEEARRFGGDFAACVARASPHARPRQRPPNTRPPHARRARACGKPVRAPDHLPLSARRSYCLGGFCAHRWPPLERGGGLCGRGPFQLGLFRFRRRRRRRPCFCPHEVRAGQNIVLATWGRGSVGHPSPENQT